MRRKQAKAKPRQRRVAEEPMAEGVMRTGRGRTWSSLDPSGLVSFARDFIRENKIASRKELERLDSGLYQALRRRGLMDRVGLESGNRDYRCWAAMDDGRLVEFAKDLIKEKGIRSKNMMQKVDCGLYSTLMNRGLMGMVGLESAQSDWASMSDGELVGFAQEVIQRNGIPSRGRLQKEEKRLYDVLLRRRLLDGLRFEIGKRETREKRDWASMSDEELVLFAMKTVDERGITTRRGLVVEDPGLSDALRNRGLIDRVGVHRENMDWGSLSDDVLVGFASRFCEKEGIRNRHQLKKGNPALYQALRRRELLDRPPLEQGKRDWAAFGREGLIAYAERAISGRGIGSRSGLQKEDPGLYRALLKRGLLDEVFSGIEGQNEKRYVREVVRALGEFG